MKYALDVQEDPDLPRADRLILLTPMIGITRFARFAGLASLPALLPPFAKAAWLSVMPEFNPFKYNSFPVNGARQSYRLTDALQAQISRLARGGQLGGLPPVLTFQSVIDFTVSTPAILTALYANLPDNGSEIVLFDVNRTLKFGPLLRRSVYVALERLIPTAPRPIAHVHHERQRHSEGSSASSSRASSWRSPPDRHEYPPDIFSLSHLAIPIPMDDPLYGLEPDPGMRDLFGISLGAMAARGERGALVVDQEFLARLPSNPFFPYLLSRIDERIERPRDRAAATSQ